MSSDQGWFESDDDYRRRVSREADESTISELTGSAPSPGWFESEEGYRERISQEATELRVRDLSGSAPSREWLEDDTSYRDRLSREVDELTVGKFTGSVPSRGWFEDEDDFRVRLRREANEKIVESSTGSLPERGWLEGDHEYRSRIAHEAREARRRGLSAGSSHDEGRTTYDPYWHLEPTSPPSSAREPEDPEASRALMIGILSLFFFPLLAPVAIIMGNQAKKRLQPTSQAFKTASTGVKLGWFVVVLLTGILSVLLIGIALQGGLR